MKDKKIIEVQYNKNVKKIYIYLNSRIVNEFPGEKI